MLDLLSARPGVTIAELARDAAQNPAKTRVRMSAVGVLKHVRVLERAGLVISEREGRVRRLYFNPVPIQLIYDRWTDQYQGFWSARLADIKERLELGARGAGEEHETHRADAPHPGRETSPAPDSSDPSSAAARAAAHNDTTQPQRKVARSA